MNRRTILKSALVTACTTVGLTHLRDMIGNRSLNAARPLWQDPEPTPPTDAGPQFKLDLCGGRVGITANQDQLIGLASKHGFAAVEPLVWELKALAKEKIDELNAKRNEAKLVWSAANLPVEFRTTEEKFQADLKDLAPAAKALQDAGVTRVGTWIMPCHDNLTYRANFREHAARLKETAKVLEQHGLRLGLEYVGTKSLWSSKRFPFLHTMKETLELIAVIGQNNVGLVLDSWHWTMAGESADDIRGLTNENVVAVDLNDAPKDIPLDEQNDTTRELPMATGVIDMKSFLQALVDIKYDGPVRAEPFNKPLNEMEDDAAAAKTAEAMKKALATIGA